jgi:hypothetical protein
MELRNVPDQPESPPIAQRAWRDRVNPMAILPGKTTRQADALRHALAQLPVGTSGTVTLFTAVGDERSYSAEEIFTQQLSGNRLVVRDANSRWTAPDEVLFWQAVGDNDYLARYLHANVKFFGELLQRIDEKTRTADLLSAAGEYGLFWQSPDQIHRRTGWMQSLGLLERWGLARLVVTDRGRDFLQRVEVVSPDDVRGDHGPSETEPVQLPEMDLGVATDLARIGPDDLVRRRVTIGYIPAGREKMGAPPRGEEGSGAVTERLRRFVEILGEGASADEFFRRASEQLGQKRSSFNQSLMTFRHMQLIDQVAMGRYAPTPKALSLLQLGNEVNLMRHLHAHYRFLGEMLTHLRDVATVSALASVAQSRYSCRQIENSEVRTRLALMFDAGLVERIDWTRYRTTPAGLQFVKEIPLEVEANLEDDSVVESGAPTVNTPLVADICEDLRRFGRVSDASEEFERSVARAFEFFGFRAEHLGGSGRTDVLVEAQLSVADRYRSIVDAKASASGVIGDNAVNFDVLKGHRRKHDAQYGLIVGPEFSARVKEWAGNNEMSLLTIEELIGLLERHERAPLSLPQLRSLFEHSQSDLSELEERYDQADQTGRLLSRLVEMLLHEANEEDPVAEGFISRENLHYVLRKEVSPRPSKATIDDLLSLLESNPVQAVQRTGERFKLVDAPSNVLRRLRMLGSGLGQIQA